MTLTLLKNKNWIPYGINERVVNEWDRIRLDEPNPLELDESVLENSLKVTPHKDFVDSDYLGRYLIPFSCISFNTEEQSRDKSNDVDHVTQLRDRYEIMGYSLDALPIIGTINEGNEILVEGISGFHRNAACELLGQSFYIVDLYRFKTPLARRIARNQANHHKDVSLTQSINDYVKEIVNAWNADEIEKTEEAVKELAFTLAEGDKTSKQIEKSIVPKAVTLLGNVYSDFRTYSSMRGKKVGKHTLNNWIQVNGFVEQGVTKRDDQALIDQGYISYCAGEGDNKATWARAIQHGERLGIPVWVFGYAKTRTSDLQEFRKNWIKDFLSVKSIYINWAYNITDSSSFEDINEDVFWCKFGGFLPQHVKPDSSKGGRETEVGLVDMYGEPIDFDSEGRCLSESFEENM